MKPKKLFFVFLLFLWLFELARMVLETNVEIRYQEILPTLSPDDHNFLHQSPVWVGFFPIRDKKKPSYHFSWSLHKICSGLNYSMRYAENFFLVCTYVIFSVKKQSVFSQPLLSRRESLPMSDSENPRTCRTCSWKEGQIVQIASPEVLPVWFWNMAGKEQFCSCLAAGLCDFVPGTACAPRAFGGICVSAWSRPRPHLFWTNNWVLL